MNHPGNRCMSLCPVLVFNVVHTVQQSETELFEYSLLISRLLSMYVMLMRMGEGYKYKTVPSTPMMDYLSL